MWRLQRYWWPIRHPYRFYILWRFVKTHQDSLFDTKRFIAESEQRLRMMRYRMYGEIAIMEEAQKPHRWIIDPN